MSDIGYIQVHAYTSQAEIPLENVAIAITDSSDSAIALRLTNRSGILDVPIPISVPMPSAGQSPDTGIIPYTRVNLYARISDYEQIEIEDLQIFPNTITVQNLEMIPLSEYPDSWNKKELFKTQPQNL